MYNGDKIYKKILLCVDGSKFAERAAEHALFISSFSDAEVMFLSVVETNFSAGLPADESIYQINGLLKQEAEKNVEKVLKVGKNGFNDIKTTTKIDEGSPSEIILETIEKENIDLVIMGNSGKSGFDKLIIGSVADKVTKKATCSVLIAQ
ncbi:putative universal stress protein [Methanobrevibacter cuticularis]|uniref:Putative universal stress protein n=1 Tax=Methanobrevibacter cuticularis TaxID=47311 RepID=A0A166CM61_9EURY|nr:universal stress protein [Methanobrevibacter cuticularis]KZX14656.1 putative universal stress protein [Methanobrevibacter cuticularis]